MPLHYRPVISVLLMDQTVSSLIEFTMYSSTYSSQNWPGNLKCLFVWLFFDKLGVSSWKLKLPLNKSQINQMIKNIIRKLAQQLPCLSSKMWYKDEGFGVRQIWLQFLKTSPSKCGALNKTLLLVFCLFIYFYFKKVEY